MNNFRTIIVLALTLSACSTKAPTDPTTGVMEDGSDAPGQEGPGSEAWGNEDVNCESHSDCLVGESCLSNVCQPSQCEGGLDRSEAPIGSTFTFFADNEIGIADRQPFEDSFWIDGYDPSATSAAYANSWEIGSHRMVDITGGRYEDSDEAVFAVAIEGRSALGFTSDDEMEWVNLSFMPIALDAGDTDLDGLDEVVTVSEDGDIAICHMDELSCETYGWSDETVTVKDLGVGDVDGDAVNEVVTLVEFDGDDFIYVMNLDASEDNDQPESYQAWVENPLRIDVGDLDGDRIAEVVLLINTDDVPLGSLWAEDDSIEIYTIAASETDDDIGTLNMVSSITTEDLTDIEDIDVADTDTDQAAEIYAVDKNGTLAAFDMEAGTLYERFSKTLGTTNEPYRLALADTDGDSPLATLSDGPTLAKGAPIPGALVLMPPYDQDHSEGPAGSFYGSGETVREEYSDTISLGMSIDLGVKASFTEYFSASFNQSVSWRVRQTHAEASRRYVGGRFGMSANPEQYGPYHGAVVLHWGCFDTYTYEISDPSGIVDTADGQNFVLTVPVGGSVSVWSVARYNAMAEALGTLPVIDVPYVVGDVDDYPDSPERMDGSAIPNDDLVFPEEEWYTAPDVGAISFWRSIDESISERSSLDTSLGSSVGVTVAGVSVGLGAEYGWGEGYSLTIGKSALFAGSVKAVPDDPNTPEDEYAQYTYRFSPVVYREWYENALGEDAAFYVMTYVAER